MFTASKAVNPMKSRRQAHGKDAGMREGRPFEWDASTSYEVRQQRKYFRKPASTPRNTAFAK